MLAYQQQEATPGAMYIILYRSFLSKVQRNLTSQMGIFTKAPFHQIHAHVFFASLRCLNTVSARVTCDQALFSFRSLKHSGGTGETKNMRAMLKFGLIAG